MIKFIKQLFSPKNKELRNRILFTLGILFIYKLGTTITVPGAPAIESDLGFITLLNSMTGGAFSRTAIFALGVSPYVTVSIIMGPLKKLIPYFNDLSEQGAVGVQKLNTISRYIGIGVAFIQSIVYGAYALGNTVGTIELIKFAIIMTAGTAFVIWLADQITQKGVGNGISLIIMAGIVSTLPSMFIDVFNEFVVFTGTVQQIALGIVSFLLFVLMYLVIIVGVVFIEASERRVPIQYSHMTSSAYGSKQNYIPFKLNSAGVTPVIYASMFLSIFALLATFINKEGFTLFVSKYLTYYNSLIGFLIYMLLILGFTFFQSFDRIRPKELSENLTNNGGYIPGIRPKDTAKYISGILVRITIFGALFLIVLVSLPIIVNNFTDLPASVQIGGTSLLIVVGVAIETYTQIENKLSENVVKKSRRRRV